MADTRVVTKISCCWVNTTSRQGIKQLMISFGSVFLLFSNATSWGHVHNSSWGKSLAPALNESPAHTLAISTKGVKGVLVLKI